MSSAYSEIYLTSLRGTLDSNCQIGESLFQALSYNFELISLPSRRESNFVIEKNKIGLYGDVLWYINESLHSYFSPAFINIAYTMFEGNSLPSNIVEIINAKFDAIIVPDNFLVGVYKNSGVIKPIFNIPLPMLGLNNISLGRVRKDNAPFVFGYIGGLVKRKGIHILLEAFTKQFGNNLNFELRIHGSWWEEKVLAEVISLSKKYNNIKLSHGMLPFEESCSFYQTIDAYIAISAGEGYSLTPREAIYAEIPVILSNYGVQKTLAESGFVYSLEPLCEEDAFIESYGGYCGTYKFPSSKQLICAMEDLYSNYYEYKNKIIGGRKFIDKNFSLKVISSLFEKLLNPEIIKLGGHNSIDDNGFTTNSEDLANKFCTINHKIILST